MDERNQASGTTPTTPAELPPPPKLDPRGLSKAIRQTASSLIAIHGVQPYAMTSLQPSFRYPGTGPIQRHA